MKEQQEQPVKEIKDYLHLYLPVAVELNNGGSKVYNRIAVAVGNMDDEYRYVTLRLGVGAKAFTNAVLFSDNRVKPILRPLSDITKEIEHNGERFVPLKVLAGWAGTCGSDDWIVKDEYTVEHFKVKGCTLSISSSGDLIMKRSNKWKDFEVCAQQILIFIKLIDWNFDLFGLIESGLAIDATKVGRISE